MKLGMKRAVAIVAAGALAVSMLVLAGCSSAESGNASEPNFDVADIEVTQSGYTLADDGTMRFAFTATNPNEGHLAKNVVFSLEAYDSDNRIVAGAGVTVPLMYPGHEEAACGSTQVYANVAASTGTAADEGAQASAAQATDSDVDVAYVQIVPVMDSIEWSDTIYDESQLAEGIVVDSTSKSNGADGSLAIAAKVSTTFDEASLLAVALLFDADGNPICGSNTTSFECSANGGVSSIEVSVDDAPEYAHCYIYVTLGAEL